MSTDLKVTDLKAYQRREIKALTDKGWTVVRVRRLHDDLNPWATVDMRSPGAMYSSAVLPCGSTLLAPDRCVAGAKGRHRHRARAARWPGRRLQPGRPRTARRHNRPRNAAAASFVTALPVLYV